jgi:hypothetical protein
VALVSRLVNGSRGLVLYHPHSAAQLKISNQIEPVLRIRIHMFLGLPDPDPLVRGMDPDPALDLDPFIIMKK